MTNEVSGSRWSVLRITHGGTRAQAIADGAIVDVSELARRCGFSVPVAITRGLAMECAAWSPDATERLLRFACETIRASQAAAGRLALSLRGFAGQPIPAAAHIGPCDDGETVVTLMYPGQSDEIGPQFQKNHHEYERRRNPSAHSGFAARPVAAQCAQDRRAVHRGLGRVHSGARRLDPQLDRHAGRRIGKIRGRRRRASAARAAQAHQDEGACEGRCRAVQGDFARASHGRQPRRKRV